MAVTSPTLERLDRGDADVLISAKLDRVSRSVRDFAGLLERAQRKGWRLVLLDLGDTSTAAGPVHRGTAEPGVGDDLQLPAMTGGLRSVETSQSAATVGEP